MGVRDTTTPLFVHHVPVWQSTSFVEVRLPTHSLLVVNITTTTTESISFMLNNFFVG